MKLKKWIRKKMFSTPKGKLIFYNIRRVREFFVNKFVSDEKFIKSAYKKRHNVDINLSSPVKFTEKLQWLKLFYRDDKMPICSDKYAIRDFLREKGFEELANELIGVYEKADDIDFNSLPDKFVVKANHGSGWNFICEDKNSVRWKDQKKIFDVWMKLNLNSFGREWNYKNIPPKIVIEKFIEHKPLNDYKLMCFNGEPLYIQLNNDHEGNHYVDFYDISTWTHLPITYDNFLMSDRVIDKPPMLKKMIEYARVLSKDFPFVRVDFYNFDDTLILGEMTFFPSSGMWAIIPTELEYDRIFGNCLKLPNPNHNLELLKKIQNK